MKTSEALRRTKAHVWIGTAYQKDKDRYCCAAAARCGGAVRFIVQPILCDLLKPCGTLEVWIENQTGESPIVVFGGVEKMQATRHAWLDHLIAHYESMGD